MQEFHFKINGHNYNVIINDISGSNATVTVNGKTYSIDLNSDIVLNSGVIPNHITEDKNDGKTDVKNEGKHRKVITSPLPGIIIEMKAGRGQSVQKGEKIAVLEAMKMENDILAPTDGIVSNVFVSKGDAVLEGAKIAEIE